MHKQEIKIPITDEVSENLQNLGSLIKNTPNVANVYIQILMSGDILSQASFVYHLLPFVQKGIGIQYIYEPYKGISKTYNYLKAGIVAFIQSSFSKKQLNDMWDKCIEEQIRLSHSIHNSKTKLSNPDFTKAPIAVVEKEKQKLFDFEYQYGLLDEQMTYITLEIDKLTK
jgi:hypothetical protein